MKIRTEILAIISRGEFDGPNFRITDGQLDRKVYQEVAKVIDAVGGRWSRKAQSLVFDGVTAAEALEPLILTGEVVRTKQEFGQFDTPETLASEVVDFADIRPGMYVLEPSCGIGNLVLAIEGDSGCAVHAFEISAQRLHKAKERCQLAGGTHLGDFLAARPNPVFDAVVMNPTFANRADIAHVRHAARFLKPNEGTVTAIMSAGVAFREDRLAVDFRKFVADRRGSIDPLPEDSFKATGTSVNTVMVQFRG